MDKNENRIRNLRKDLGMSQTEFGQYIRDLTGISCTKQFVHSVEYGINYFQPQVYVALSKDNGVSIDYLLGRSDHETPYQRCHYSPTPLKTKDRISGLRKDKNLSRRKLCEELRCRGLDKPLVAASLFKIETGKQKSEYPPMRTLLSLADFFTVPVDYLLSLTDCKKLVF